jgi:hypothetical protein
MESMFTAPRRGAQEGDENGLSAWPALAAAFFAWMMAFVRVVIGRIRHEAVGLDLALAIGAAVLIPAIALSFWLNSLRNRRARSLASNTPSAERPRLTLVSSVLRPRAALRTLPSALATSLHKKNTRQSA